MTNPYAPPQAVVQDIAEVTEGIVPADRATRLGAAILDGLIFGVMVYMPMVAALMLSGFGRAAATGEPPTFDNFGTIMVVTGIAVVIWVAINLKLMRDNGQSIGKKATGIKVVRSDGSDASLGRLVWLRNVVNILLGIIPLYGIIDVLFIFGESRRCIHDHIADTIVIKA
jgi:uncharacterized RDD family membrane protein YckC